MIFDRTKNAKRNIVWGSISKIAMMILPFLIRTVFIYTLGNLYLGLNSLFTSILNALNLAELGIGSALVFSMYKPIVENDKEKIRALLNLYRKTYYVVGLVVITAGLMVLPFLPYFINGEYPTDINIYIIYLLQLGSTVSGYFFMAYKSSVLIAYQKTYIINIVNIIIDFISYSLCALVLIIWQNYYLFIIISLFFPIIKNVIIALIVKKKYPDLNPVGNLDKANKRKIFKKTAALFGHKVAALVINSVDNILISAFIGLEVVAIFNNYFYIITALSGFFLILINGLTAIVGNYVIEHSKKEAESLFMKMHLGISILLCFCCTCLLNMFQPFISLWAGVDNTLPFSSVILFSIYFFAVKIRTACLLFKDAFGSWEKDMAKAYIMIVIDLVIDLVLLNTIGINGALISTIISMFFAFIYETHVLFKYCLNSSPTKYYLNTLLFFFITFVSCSFSYFICSLIKIDNYYLELLFNGIISAFISLASFIIFTFWMKEFRELICFIKQIFLRKRR